jgi:RHS repeat-associated protein
LETWYYTWDNRNRLIGVEQTSDGVNILLAVTYTYDANDKLVAEEKWQSSTGVVTTRRHWDGEDLWAITDASNVVAARYLYGDGVDQVQGRIVEVGPNAGTQGFYATDNLGSVRDIIGAATGEVLYHAECDAFGAATEYGAGYGDTLKYTAREFDADTGLQYNRARWYDNTTGRWLSEDPIGFRAGDHNLYRYVNNNPIIFIDYSGKEAAAFVWSYTKDINLGPAPFKINLGVYEMFIRADEDNLFVAEQIDPRCITISNLEELVAKIDSKYRELKHPLSVVLVAHACGGVGNLRLSETNETNGSEKIWENLKGKVKTLFVIGCSAANGLAYPKFPGMADHPLVAISKKLSNEESKCTVKAYDKDITIIGRTWWWQFLITPRMMVDGGGQLKTVVDGVISGEPLPKWLQNK